MGYSLEGWRVGQNLATKQQQTEKEISESRLQQQYFNHSIVFMCHKNENHCSTLSLQQGFHTQMPLGSENKQSRPGKVLGSGRLFGGLESSWDHLCSIVPTWESGLVVLHLHTFKEKPQI